MMKGRNLVILLGIPTWLFLIWKGDIYYTLFILICMVLALGEFYTLMEKKGLFYQQVVGDEQQE